MMQMIWAMMICQRCGIFCFVLFCFFVPDGAPPHHCNGGASQPLYRCNFHTSYQELDDLDRNLYEELNDLDHDLCEELDYLGHDL